MRRLLVLALLASLPTLAFAKADAWSEIDGTFATPAQADLADVAVVALDGKTLPACTTRPARVEPSSSTGSLFGDHANSKRAPRGACVTATKRLKLAPGTHATTIASTRLPSGGGMVTQPFAFEAAPCMRYQLVAHHEGPGALHFAVEIAGQERIDKCTAPELAAATAAPDAASTNAPTVDSAGSPAR